MVARISSALVVALALVAAGGQKPQQQESSMKAPNLAAIADDEVQFAILDYVYAKMDGHHDKEAEFLATLPAGVRALYLVSGVEDEVNNGGFNQYYWNSAGKFADQAVAAFEYFAAHEHAALMREANRIHAAEQAEIEKFKQQGTLQAFSDSYKVSKLGPLDERFYKLGENLSTLIVAKIRADPASFALQ